MIIESREIPQFCARSIILPSDSIIASIPTGSPGILLLAINITGQAYFPATSIIFSSFVKPLTSFIIFAPAKSASSARSENIVSTEIGTGISARARTAGIRRDRSSSFDILAARGHVERAPISIRSAPSFIILRAASRT
ncbi:Uncharacterised protein [uncultured archaeon]|nr:Uncharacterised protein [uncultured archaeon]